MRRAAFLLWFLLLASSAAAQFNTIWGVTTGQFSLWGLSIPQPTVNGTVLTVGGAGTSLAWGQVTDSMLAVSHWAAQGSTARSGASNFPVGDSSDHYIVAAGGVALTKFYGFPAVDRLNDGRILMVFDSGASSQDNGHQIYKTYSSDDGYTWTTPTLVLSNASYGCEVGGLKNISGVLYLTGMYEQFTPSIVVEGSFLLTSADSGATWTTTTTIDDGTSPMCFRPYSPSAGTILTPCYTIPAGHTLESVIIRKSVNSGSTWTTLATVANGDGLSAHETEPFLLKLANGNLLCSIRDTTNSLIKLATSTDTGATWSALVSGPAIVSIFPMYQVSDGKIVGVGRAPAALADQRPVYSVSTDNGATWSARLYLENQGDAGVFEYADFVNVSLDRVMVAYGKRPAASNYSDIRIKYLASGGGIDPIGGVVGKSLVISDGDVAVVNSGTGTGGIVDNTQRFTLFTSATTSKGIVVQGLSGQTASALEVQNSAGTAVLAVTPEIKADGTIPLISVTGTIPSVITANALGSGMFINITGAGSSAKTQEAMRVYLSAGYTGSKSTYGVTVDNSSSGTATFVGTSWSSANYGVQTAIDGTTTGYNVGQFANASGSSTLNVALVARGGPSSGDTSPVVGVIGIAQGTGTTTKIGGLFGTQTATVPSAAGVAALVADVGTDAVPIFRGRYNGAETFQITNAGVIVSAGQTGMTTVVTVRNAGGSADCTMTYTGGILTATTCSHT